MKLPEPWRVYSTVLRVALVVIGAVVAVLFVGQLIAVSSPEMQRGVLDRWEHGITASNGITSSDDDGLKGEDASRERLLLAVAAFIAVPLVLYLFLAFTYSLHRHWDYLVLTVIQVAILASATFLL